MSLPTIEPITNEIWHKKPSDCPHAIQDGLDHRCPGCDVERYMEDEFPPRTFAEEFRDASWIVPVIMVALGLFALMLFLLQGGA